MQRSKQDETDMTLMKKTLPVLATLGLAACVSDGGNSASVNRAPVPVADCAYLQGLSAEHVAKIGSARCGPQAELPYTFAE